MFLLEEVEEELGLFFIYLISPAVFACLKSTMETREQYIKYV